MFEKKSMRGQAMGEMGIMEWIRAHDWLLAWMGLAGLLMLLGSMVFIPLMVACMPSDYFVRLERGGPPRGPFRRVLQVLKNLLGVLLLLAGLLLLVLPGQGVLTMVIGLSLIDFPGKHRMQVRLVRVHRVRNSMQWIRHKAHRPPLELPDRQL